MSNSNAGPRLGRLPISRFHVRILCVIGAGMFLDIFELTLAAGVLVAPAIAYPLTMDVRLIVAIGFALVTTVYVLSCLAIAIYVPELFPTEVRMRGAGFCNMAARLAVIGIQPLVVPLYQYGGVTGVVLMLALVLACVALVVAVFGEETNSLSLEELDPTTA